MRFLTAILLTISGLAHAQQEINHIRPDLGRWIDNNFSAAIMLDSIYQFNGRQKFDFNVTGKKNWKSLDSLCRSSLRTKLVDVIGFKLIADYFVSAESIVMEFDCSDASIVSVFEEGEFTEDFHIMMGSTSIFRRTRFVLSDLLEAGAFFFPVEQKPVPEELSKKWIASLRNFFKSYQVQGHELKFDVIADVPGKMILRIWNVSKLIVSRGGFESFTLTIKLDEKFQGSGDLSCSYAAGFSQGKSPSPDRYKNVLPENLAEFNLFKERLKSLLTNASK